MNFGSVCSGVEAASLAWEPLGWKASFFSEIEKFPCAVLAHRWPQVPNRGDMTKFKEWPNDSTIDVLVGGTPCQSFSVAGLRKGLDDPRGNLMLTFGAIAAKYRPTWLVWENVPGVLSSNGGKDFGTFLGMLGELGYGYAYRVLDAQYFGVAQRRRRVFVIGHLGNWRAAAAVLFERHSLSGNPAPSRETGKEAASHAGGGFETAGTLDARTEGGGFPGSDGACSGHVVPVEGFDGGDAIEELSPTIRAGWHANSHANAGVMPAIAFPANLSGTQCASTEEVAPAMGAKNPTAIAYSIQAGALRTNPDSGPDGVGVQADHAYTLESRAEVQAVAVSLRGRDGGGTAELGDHVQNCLRASNGGGDKPHVLNAMRVRRLTPRECERLQGMPDDHTLVPYRGKPAADGPRYKAIGNSMAVPCMHWLGRRIQMVDDLCKSMNAKTAEL